MNQQTRACPLGEFLPGIKKRARTYVSWFLQHLHFIFLFLAAEMAQGIGNDMIPFLEFTLATALA